MPALSAATLAVALALSSAEPTVALLPVSADGLASDQVARVEKLVRGGAERMFGARLQKDGVTRQRIEAGEQRGLACDRSSAFRRPLVTDCLVSTGVGVETEQVLAVRASRVEGKVGVLRLEVLQFDVVSGKSVRRVVRTIALDDAGVSDVLDRLYDDELAGAVLVAKNAPAGAVLLLDGLAPVPVPERMVLEAGVHVVEIAASASTPAAERQRHVIDAESGTQTEIDARPGAPPVVAADVGASAPAAAGGGARGGGIAVLPMAAAATVAVLGGVLVVVGVIPRVGYSLDAAALAELDADVRKDPGLAGDKAAEIRDRRASLEGNAASWETWGVPFVLVGSSVLVGGAAFAVALAVAPVLAE